MKAPPSTFNDAVREFVDQSTKKKLPSFIRHVFVDGQIVTAEEVQATMMQLEKDTSRQTSRRVLRPVFEALLDYDGVIGTLIQADPMPSALIWGGLKAVLECIRRYNGLFEKIESQLKSLSRHLTRLKEYEKLFVQSNDMEDLLRSSYLSIIKFWARVEEQCSTRGFVLAAQSLTSFSTRKLDEIITDIAEDSDNITKLVPIVQERLRRKEQEDARNERSQAGIVLKEILENQHEEREARRKEEARQWIGYQDRNYDERHQQYHQRSAPGTGNWLLEDPHFTHWQNSRSGSNILWLKGGSGVGKSVMCAHVINNLQKNFSKSAIAFYYFTFNESERISTVYREIAWQLFHELYTKTTEISDDVYEITRGAPNLSSTKQLIKVLIAELETTFLFLDGIDEETADKDRWQQTSEIMSFMIDIAKQTNSPLKLWCSSQDRRSIRSLLKGCEEIQLGASTNGRDIETYFEKALESEELEEVSAGTKNDILRQLKRQVNGNFLWASVMISSISAEAVGIRELQRLVREGLPQSFEAHLRNKIRNLRPAQYGFLSKVFSCLVYAKRPLQMDELCEALEIMECSDNENLKPGCGIFKDRLQDLCAPLVNVDEITTQSGKKKQIATLSHGSVKTFLTKNPNILSNEKELRICSSRMAWASIRYLRQPQYSQPLVKIKGAVVTADNQSIMDHQLLNYSAKYWYRHMDDLPYSPETCKYVEKFVRSTNFATCLQAQSLLVEGQFATYFSSQELNLGVQTVRMFPHWFTQRHHCGESLQRQYQSAIREWGYYLDRVSNIRGRYPSQIDRCWWASLGKSNFLHKTPSTFKSFIFEKSDAKEYEKSLYMWERIDPSGTQLDLFSLDLSNKQDATATTVFCERWTLSRGRSPKLAATYTMEIASEDLRLYRRLPKKITIGVPRPVGATEDGGLIRVGPHVYVPKTADRYTFCRLDLAEHQMDYVHEIGSNKMFFAVASRSRFTEDDLMEEDHKDEPVAMDGKQNNRKAVSSGSFNSSSNSGSSSDSDDARETETQNLATKREGFLSKADKDESSTDIFSNDSLSLKESEEETPSVDEFDREEDDSIESNSARESWSEGSTAAISDEYDDESMWHDLEFSEDNQQLDESSDEEEEYDDEQEAYDSDNLCESKASSRAAGSLASLKRNRSMSPPSSPAPSFGSESFSEDSDEPEFSNSEDGDSGDDEIDEDDRSLRLAQLMGFGVHDKAKAKGHICSIKVFGFALEDGKAPCIFRFTQRSGGPLYSSPPVFHPTGNLLVWPLGADEILFANFTEKTYFTRIMRTTDRNSCQISVNCCFSACGGYLHIASLGGLVLNGGDAGSAFLGLRLHISTHRLSQGKLSRSPPRLIFNTSVNLKPKFSEAERLSVSNLPYTLTWTASHVYITESDILLRVYRVPLYREVQERERTPDAPKAVFVNQGDDVNLPASADSRRVYFFPHPTVQQREEPSETTGKSKKSRPSTEYIAHAILGAQSSSERSISMGDYFGKESIERIPPQGVHLTRLQLGEWDSAEGDRRGIQMLKRVETWRGGQLLEKFENFSTSEDCDIVPYLGS